MKNGERRGGIVKQAAEYINISLISKSIRWRADDISDAQNRERGSISEQHRARRNRVVSQRRTGKMSGVVKITGGTSATS